MVPPDDPTNPPVLLVPFTFPTTSMSSIVVLSQVELPSTPLPETPSVFVLKTKSDTCPPITSKSGFDKPERVFPFPSSVPVNVPAI
jgi:hypothetical protein